jgi:DNA-directed RNA polymerase subunit RPC12/RpoP
MLNCPSCGSSKIVSNRPLTQAHIARAADAARFLQSFGDRRWSVLAGLGALGMQGVNALYKECRCGACGHTFDHLGDPNSAL